jgi:hydroxyethylthiazole kinase-like sugar kinase family protein
VVVVVVLVDVVGVEVVVVVESGTVDVVVVLDVVVVVDNGGPSAPAITATRYPNSEVLPVGSVAVTDTSSPASTT